MNKLLYNFLPLILAFGIFMNPLSSQTPSASFATWKDNNKSAYVIIHDDYGDVTTAGIVLHADNEAFTRGIKLTFGAITSVCEDQDWTDAKKMMSHGHECINHSHNHYCAQPVSWCPSQVYTATDFKTELGLSTDLIRNNTGVSPRFFIHPYDLSTDEVINYLKGLGYLGTRGGNQEEVNTANYTDPYRLNYHVFQPTSKLADLNAGVDVGISSGGLVLRELHGVQDDSWAMVTLANYQSHLNYVKSKMDQKLLWSATITDVITYKMQRDAYQPIVAYTASTNTINVSFNTLKTIDPSVLRTPVTVNVNLNGVAGNYDVFQGTNVVTSTRSGNIVSFNVYPNQGAVTLTCKDCNVVTPPTTATNILNLAATAQTNAVALTWSNPTVNFDEVMIVAQPTAAFTTVPSGTGYVADANYGGTGTTFENGKVIYKGTGTNVTTIGLTAGIKYYFKAFSRFGTVWSNGVEVSAIPGAIVPPPTTGFDPTACYRLTARHSNKVLDLSSNSTSNGLQLVQNTWTGANRQIWRIKAIDATYYQLVNGYSGKVVNVANSSKSAGANLTQQSYSNSAQKQWKLDKNTEGFYNISNKNSNMIMDVYGDATADGTRIIQWNKNNGANQDWTIQAVGCPTNVAALLTERDIVFNGNLENQSAVLQWVVNSEDLIDYYQIEKANDNHDFEHLTYVNGNSKEALRSFSFVDEKLTDGNNYYRLKSINADGTFQMSEVITVKYERQDLYTVSPNPASDYINVDLTPAGNRNVDIQVVSILGKVVVQERIEAGSNSRFHLDVQSLDAGQYIIKIQPQGQRLTVRKLVIIK
jgi:Ricin-type beta-trefoil lectin domain-like/Secretion system C-terminal sorting domain/Polysaccharide deacetylase